MLETAAFPAFLSVMACPARNVVERGGEVCPKPRDGTGLRFIVANRYNVLSAAEHNLERRFDIVHGLVADDKIVQILDDLRNELISEEEALAKLRAAPYQTVQYSFHTERAVAYLNRLEVVNV